MKRVRFSRAHLMYQAGETAGFDDAVAAALIASGMAVDADVAEADAKAKAEAEAAEAEAKADAGKKG